MIVEVARGRGPSAVPDAEELAAIVAVLESLRELEAVAARPPRSRWREAARSFETDPL
jgi:hypothetical protein